MTTSVFDVFTPSSFPEHTYVNRQTTHEKDIELCIKGRLIAFIHGPTKSGKSVLAEKVARQLGIPWHKVSARNFKTSNEFWDTIAAQLGIEETSEFSEGESEATRKSVNIVARIKAWFLAEAEASGTIEKQSDHNRSLSRSYKIDPIHEIQKKGKSNSLLIIDNFHYILDRQVQREILQELREIIGELSIAIIAITDKSDYLNTILPELVGRCQSITIRPWANDELMEIANKGFKKLNAEMSPSLPQTLAYQCFRAPAIMQGLCRNLALALEIESTALKRIRISEKDVTAKLNEVYKTTSRLFDMSTPYENLIRAAFGQGSINETITLRAIRNVELDTDVSYYEAVLHSIVSRQNVSMTLGELEKSLDAITIPPRDSSIPSVERLLLEIHNASDALWNIEVNNPQNDNIDAAPDTNLLKWYADRKRITIQSPYFAFFICWSGHLVEEI